MRRLTYFINHALQLHVLFVDGTRIAVKTHMHHGRHVVAADHHVLDIVLQLRAEQHRLRKSAYNLESHTAVHHHTGRVKGGALHTFRSSSENLLGSVSIFVRASRADAASNGGKDAEKQ